MTTIAANREEMAADSQWQAGDKRMMARKIYRIRGALIGIAGTVSEGLAFVEWYARGADRGAAPSLKPGCWAALVLDRSGLYEYDETLIPVPCYDEEGYAIGTGEMAAMAALKLGTTPEEAVEVACLVDTNSGPPVVVERL